MLMRLVHNPSINACYDCRNCRAIWSVAVGSSTELILCEPICWLFIMDAKKSLLSNLC